LGISFAVYIFRTNPIQDALSSSRVINTLFIIEDDRKPVSTYVLMYYPNTKRAAIFNIPGEVGQLIARTNRVDRIDSIYDPARITAYENEIKKLLGIELNFSVVITKENLVSIVDLLEGVEIFIPSAVSQRDGEKLILFPYGITNLDGDKASVYATYSLSDDDRDTEVFRRQRFFLGFLKRQIQMNERLKNPQAAKLYYSFFRTPMNQRTLMMLFDEFVYIDIDRTNVRSVDGNLQEVSGQYLIIPHWNGSLIKDIVRQTVSALMRDVEDYMVERTLTVEILNGTATTGLAGRTAETIRNFGFDVVSIGNADRNNYENTVIIHRMGDEELVQNLADVIRCTNIRQEFPSDDDQDNITDLQNYELKANVTLIIGRNFDGRYVIGN
jgi:anionic cell wall polymer biosynthesis LytR-Cps2A-Psr (LCP) family protein